MEVNRKVTATITNPNMSASDWELFTADGGAMARRSAQAAARFNDTFTKAVNGGKTRDEVEALMSKVMTTYEDTGAQDTEPQYHLARLLNRVFGTQ